MPAHTGTDGPSLEALDPILGDTAQPGVWRRFCKTGERKYGTDNLQKRHTLLQVRGLCNPVLSVSKSCAFSRSCRFYMIGPLIHCWTASGVFPLDLPEHFRLSSLVYHDILWNLEPFVRSVFREGQMVVSIFYSIFEALFILSLMVV